MKTKKTKNGLTTYSDGSKAWWLNGLPHRVDGPAYECSDGSKAWYLNGEFYDKISYYNLMIELGHMTKVEAFVELI